MQNYIINKNRINVTTFFMWTKDPESDPVFYRIRNNE